MSKVDQVLAAARSQLGVKYVFGDAKPGVAFDCSGLTQWAFGTVGVKLTHKASVQQDQVKTVAAKDRKPGDLVFWGNPAHHVAIYIGDGKVISAPHTGAVVRVQPVWGNPTYGRVPGVGTITDAIGGVVDAIGGTGGQGGGGGVSAQGFVDEVTTGARSIAFKGVALVLGVGLLASGMLTIGLKQQARIRQTAINTVTGKG